MTLRPAEGRRAHVSVQAPRHFGRRRRDTRTGGRCKRPDDHGDAVRAHADDCRTIDGNDALFAAPHIGLIFGDVGKLVYIADESDPFTPLLVLMSTGHEDASPFPAVCAALE